MCYICHYRGKMYLYINAYKDIFILCEECMSVAEDIKEYNVNLMQMFDYWSVENIDSIDDGSQ